MSDLASAGGPPRRVEPSASRFAEIARSLASEPTVARTLQRIVDVAVESIDACDGAGILLADHGAITAGAWSSELVHDLETMEFQVHEGPCLDAIWETATFESPDLRSELARWPVFAARALEAGVASMLAFRLFAADETLGALDLYSRDRDAFDDSTRAVGAALAAHGALALAGARLHAQDIQLAEGLTEALRSRDIIGQAKGILMATDKISADEAFQLLRAASQRRNVKLRDIADEVVFTGSLDRSVTPSD